MDKISPNPMNPPCKADLPAAMPEAFVVTFTV